MNIGKRNIGCLSCSVEPERRAATGKDGKVYRGKSPIKREEDKMMERANSRGSSEGKREKRKKLLAMKWDNIGLQQTQYSNTFNLHKLQELASSRKMADTAPNLYEVLTDGDSRRDSRRNSRRGSPRNSIEKEECTPTAQVANTEEQTTGFVNLK